MFHGILHHVQQATSEGVCQAQPGLDVYLSNSPCICLLFLFYVNTQRNKLQFTASLHVKPCKMSTLTQVFGVLLLALFLNETFAHTTEDMQNLINNKTKGYNKKFRPVFDQSRLLQIYASFEIIAIQEFDEVSEKFSAVGFIVMAWWDEFLKWDPADYGNMTEFAAEGGDFWQPHLVLINPHEEIKALGNDWSIFRYVADGTVYVTPGAVFEASCSVDITKYPWDEQNCNLIFMPWGYVTKEVQLVSMQKHVGLNYFTQNGAWDIVDTDSTASAEEGGASIIVFHMTLRRKPRFVLVNVILPIVFMSFLNMVVFLIPTDSGERISYCLTVLLAIAVFLTLVGDNLPKKSNPMSILSYYLLSVLAMSVCIIFATVFSLRIYFRDEKKSVPDWLASFVRCMCCRSCCRKDSGTRHKYRSRKRHRGYESDDDRPPSYRNGNDSGVFMTNGMPVAHNYHGNWRNRNGVESVNNVSSKYMSRERVSMRRSNSTASDDDDNGDKVTWKDVSCTFDIFFFFLFILLLIVTTSVYFFLVLRKDDDKDG